MHDADARPLLGFEDFRPGDRFETGSIEVSEADIVAFARQFDPQPFHMDREAAKASLFGELVGSGWHTAALTMRLIVTQGFRTVSGAIGVEVHELRWRALKPGDFLRVAGEVVEIKPSASKPDRGTVRVRYRTLNRRDEEVQHFVATMVVQRRA